MMRRTLRLQFRAAQGEAGPSKRRCHENVITLQQCRRAVFRAEKHEAIARVLWIQGQWKFDCGIVVELPAPRRRQPHRGRKTILSRDMAGPIRSLARQPPQRRVLL
jgi:hypothetical protein